MRILCTNDDGIHAPGLKVIEEIARALSDDVWMVAPELDQSGVSHSLSLNDPLAPARSRAASFCGARHADRLRDHGRAPHPRREAAGPRAVRRQQGPQRRRRRGLFRHHRRRARRHDPGHSVIRAVPGILRRDASRAAVGHRAEIRSGHPAQGDRRRRAEEHRDQRQFSRLHAR